MGPQETLGEDDFGLDVRDDSSKCELPLRRIYGTNTLTFLSGQLAG